MLVTLGTHGNVIVLLSVCLYLNSLVVSLVVLQTTQLYLMHNRGVKFYGIFSKTAPLHSSSPSSIVQLHCTSHFLLHR